MCCPRCSAITEPSIASHRNRMEASSSDQTSGACSTKRATTPANRITISASTIAAASPATAWHSTRSAWRTSRAARPVAGRASPSSPATLTPAIPPRLQGGPGLVAELALPLRVEPGLAQRVAEQRRIDGVELQAPPGEASLQAGVELRDVHARLGGGAGELAGGDRLHVGGHGAEGARVGQQPEPVPHVVGERAVLLHLVELGRVYDGERVLLAVGDPGLQGRVHLAEVDAWWGTRRSP